MNGIRRILGLRFFSGSLDDLIGRIAEGGLVVAPSAPVLVGLSLDLAHREALEGADLALTDSGFMVILWALLHGEILHRISGLRLMRGLLQRKEFREEGAAFWVMPNAEDAAANRAWLNRSGIPVRENHCYEAPRYPAGPIEASALLVLIERMRPKYVVITLGGGVQERLGYYLSTHLSYRPAILCTGAAIAFVSRRQAPIPAWVDRLFLGWLFRCLHQPAKFIPRYWSALRLPSLMWRYGSHSVATSARAAGHA